MVSQSEPTPVRVDGLRVTPLSERKSSALAVDDVLFMTAIVETVWSFIDHCFLKCWKARNRNPKVGAVGFAAWRWSSSCEGVTPLNLSFSSEWAFIVDRLCTTVLPRRGTDFWVRSRVDVGAARQLLFSDAKKTLEEIHLL